MTEAERKARDEAAEKEFNEVSKRGRYSFNPLEFTQYKREAYKLGWSAKTEWDKGNGEEFDEAAAYKEARERFNRLEQYPEHSDFHSAIVRESVQMARWQFNQLRAPPPDGLQSTPNYQPAEMVPMEDVMGLVEALEWISKGPTFGPGAPTNQAQMQSDKAREALTAFRAKWGKS